MRFFLAVLVVALTVSKTTATLEDGDLVELINVTSPVDEGITGGEYHPGPPVGPPGLRRHLSIETGDLVEKVAEASEVDEGTVGDFHPGPPVGVPTTPEGRRLDPEGGFTVVSVTQLDAHVPEERRRRLCSYSVEIRGGTTCYASGAEVVARISTCGSAGNATAGEWAGVYYNGAPNWPPYNWHYLCGGQSCNAPVAPGTYDIGFTIGTRTQNPVGPWPLPTGTYLRVYFHLGVGGTLYSNTFSVGPTCLGSNPTPVPPTPAPQPNPTPAPVTCSEGVSVQNCWGFGQTIQVSVNTCGTAVSSNPGWAGIYYAGTTNYAAALNWQYICGSQSCASAVGPANGYTLNMNSGTRGSIGWPLAVGPTYQVFIHTGSGTFASGTFQITSTGSCSGTPTSPTTPSASPPSSPSTSAPATTSSSSSSPVQTLYVQASAQDCTNVRNGNINVGTSALNSQQFFFTFALGVNGQTLSTAQIQSIVTQAFQDLIGTSLLNCSHRRFMMRKKMTLHHAKAKHGHHQNKHHHHKHHHHHERQLQQVDHFDSFNRRLNEIPENIIGFVEFQTTCEVDPACNNPFLSDCFMCTTTITVYVKGPVDQADVQAAVQAIVDSPTFFEDLGMIEDIVFLQPEEDIQIITGDPTDGPTSAPTSGPTSGPTTPTSGPTSGPTSAPTPVAVPDDPTTAGSNGDPHFKAWTGEHFEFHGQCDLVLAKDSNFANGLGLNVQIRTKLVRFWSYIKSAAINIGDDILEVSGSADTEEVGIVHYWYNLEYQGKIDTVGGFPVSVHVDDGPRRKHIFEIDLSSKYPGQKIVIDTMKEFVKVSFSNASAKAFGNTVGMLGEFKTGKTLARDQITVIQDFNEYGNEWQVLPADEMLFHDISFPQFPQRCELPEDPQGQRRKLTEHSDVSMEEAEKACAVLKDPLSIKDCIYDILATQDLDMVGAY